MKKIFYLLLFILASSNLQAAKMLIPMDESGQTNHLKAYGIAFLVLTKNEKVDWLLNYKGGSFVFDYFQEIENECKIRNVSYEILPDAKYTSILTEIADPEVNMDIVRLEKAPKIAVYTPDGKLPWDDAVTMVLTYAEIPFDKVYDDETKTF